MKALFAAAAIVAAGPVIAPGALAAEPVIVPAAGSVPETVQRLKSSVEDAGAKVFSVVDLGGGVKSIGKDVGEIQLVILGDPRIGARAMSGDPLAALDLPAKILVYGGDEGTTMAYEQPADILAEWDMPPDLLKQMTKTLEKITSAAAE